jgi:hypothetical protein
MRDEATGKSCSLIVLETEEAAQRFRAFVAGPEESDRRELVGVRNESLTVVAVEAAAQR